MRWMAKVHGSGKGCAWIIKVAGSKGIAGAIRFNSFDKKWRNGQIGYEVTSLSDMTFDVNQLSLIGTRLESGSAQPSTGKSK